MAYYKWTWQVTKLLSELSFLNVHIILTAFSQKETKHGHTGSVL